MFIYFLRKRERDREWVGEGQRERDTHTIRSRLQALSCQHRVQHGAQTHRLWDNDLSQSCTLSQLSHPGAPELDHFLTPYTKINPKWMKDLNVGQETIKILEENISRNLFDFGQSNFLLDTLPKGRETKTNKSYWDLIKIKSSGAPGWLGRLSVRFRLRSWSHGPRVRAPHQALCWQLRAWSLFQILCLPLSVTLPRSCSVSLCLKNK